MMCAAPAETAEHQQSQNTPVKESAGPTSTDPTSDWVLSFFRLFVDANFNDLARIREIADRFRQGPRETFFYHFMHFLESDPALRDLGQDAYNVYIDILFRKRLRKLRDRPISGVLPNCFVIGQPRSGTTSLHAFFRGHPEVFVPVAKETHYYSHFSKPVLGRNGMDLDYYVMYFMDSTNERIRCDISPYYLSEPGVALRIFRDAPDAKIIALLREPVSQLISTYNLNRPWTRQEDIDSWFLAGMDGLRRSQPRWDHTGAVSVLFHCFFASQISEYKRLFGKRFKILLFEDVISQQERCYHEICDFLGIARFYQGPYWELPAPGKVRPSAEVLHRLQSLLLPEVKRIEAAIGQDLSRWYGDWNPVL
jgi:hypothetical protein